MKNRRARNAKFSEYRLRKLVQYFATGMTAKEAAVAIGFSEPTVRKHFMAIRQQLFDHGFIRVTKREGSKMPARLNFTKKHRGVPKRFSHLYEAEFLHRAFATKSLQVVKRFSANNLEHMKMLKKYVNYNKINAKYHIIEELVAQSDIKNPPQRRPFDPMDYQSTSIIYVNERNIDPQEAFFRYIWALLLKHPL